MMLTLKEIVLPVSFMYCDLYFLKGSLKVVTYNGELDFMESNDVILVSILLSLPPIFYLIKKYN